MSIQIDNQVNNINCFKELLKDKPEEALTKKEVDSLLVFIEQIISKFYMLNAAHEAKISLIKELNSNLEEKDITIGKLKAKLYSGLECETYEEWSKKGTGQLRAYIEAMACAYMKMCNVAPDKVIINETVSDDGKSIRYWAAEREENLQAVEWHPVLRLEE